MRVVLVPLTLLAMTATVVHASPGTDATPDAAPLLRIAPPISRSLGSPTRGALEGGVFLAEGPHLRHTVERAGDAHRFGTARLVRMLQDVAARVGPRVGAPLLVGELSSEAGGEIPGHRSHESGRDVDLGFFFRDAGGRPTVLDHFVRVDREGLAHTADATFVFDEAANWAVIEALITHPIAEVRHVFVANSLKARLLAFAEARGVAADLLARAANILKRPGAIADPHESHFHVRIACDEADGEACHDPGRSHSAHRTRAQRAPHHA